MSKPKTIEYFSGKWWVNPEIWQNVGSEVVSRPTEHIALSNISLQSKYIRNLSKWQLDFTEQEILVYRIDKLIHSQDFDIDYYREKYKVYSKDIPVVKISKITGFSEVYVRRILKNISSKVYLCDTLNIEIDLDNIDNNKNKEKKYKDLSSNKYLNSKRNSYYKRIGKYKKNTK